MALEIRELVIRVNVGARDGNKSELSPHELEKLRLSIVDECLDRLQKKMKKRSDR